MVVNTESFVLVGMWVSKWVGKLVGGWVGGWACEFEGKGRRGSSNTLRQTLAPCLTTAADQPDGQVILLA